MARSRAIKDERKELGYDTAEQASKQIFDDDMTLDEPFERRRLVGNEWTG